MWIMTTRGFVSVVSDRDRDGYVLVRARRRSHLEHFLHLFPALKEKIVETPNADYRWRASLPQLTFSHVVREHVDRIDYTNFKAETARHDPELASLYGDVWGLGYRYQTVTSWGYESPLLEDGTDS